MERDIIKEIEKRIGHKFRNKELLAKAFTHSSIANVSELEGNERLEFFGDSVLGFIVSEHLYQKYSNPEGELSVIRSRLVSSDALSAVVDELKIAEFLVANKSIDVGKQLPKGIKADLFESVLGAIYCDGGMDRAKRFVFSSLKLHNKNLEELLQNQVDFKTPLQELLQKNRKDKIEYKLIEQSGPPHNPEFTVELHINEKVFAKVTAKSKKMAEQKCAEQALKIIAPKKTKK